MKQELTDLRGEMNNSTIIVEVSNKIRKDIEDSDNTINQFDLDGIYRTLHPKTAEYTFFPRLQGTL